jgi:heat shock protein HslJ
MKVMKNIILSIVLGVMCMSCCSNKYVAANISGDWKIDNVLDIQVNASEEEIPFISFQSNESRFYGTTGCNSFFGEFKTTDNKNEIMLTNVGSTKKLCIDMTTEDAIFSAMSQVASVEYNNEEMQLLDINGNVVMKLSAIKK